MSESGPEPKRRDPPKQRGKGADEKLGGALGKAFGRLKKTRIWQDTKQAYREGLEGKPDE
jgi:hypothetical protein